ncbi:MAG: radical SAM protein [Thermodesulfobacteriota bacterium]
MHYQGTVIRPPSEANSIILQVTVGCSHNRCTFCGAYKEQKFQLKEWQQVAADLDFAAHHCTRLKRLFLADGDVLILPQHRLVKLLTLVKEKLPWIKRIALYANAKAIMAKSAADLQELKELGLDRVYMGLESGDDQVLAAINKGADSARMVAAATRVRQAGIFLSVTALLGIGGVTHSRSHARCTGQVLSRMAPNQIAILTLMVLENTPLFCQQQQGDFKLPDNLRLLAELREIIAEIKGINCQLQANHASNYLPINCRLPRHREQVIAEIDAALKGRRKLVPEQLRAL